jgi:hypothetical protein
MAPAEQRAVLSGGSAERLHTHAVARRRRCSSSAPSCIMATSTGTAPAAPALARFVTLSQHRLHIAIAALRRFSGA